MGIPADLEIFVKCRLKRRMECKCSQ